MQSSTPQPDPGHDPSYTPPAQGPAGGSGGGCRLNLLLSFGGWQADSWADRLPALLAPVGVQSLRAHTATEAADLIRNYPVHLAVVDLRLPFGRPSASLGCAPGASAGMMNATLPASAPGGCAPTDEAGPKVLELLARLDSPPPTIVVKRGRSTREDMREMQHALRVGAFAAIDPPVHLEDMLRLMQRVLNRYYAGRWPSPPAPPPPTFC